MCPQETVNEKQEVMGSNTLNRVIARGIDILIVTALLELLSKTGYFAGLLYILIADGLLNGRSVGKWLIGLRVIVLDTQASCTYRESIFRNLPFAIGYIIFGLLKGIPIIGWLFAIVVPVVILGVEALIMIGNEEGMRFGDQIAKTKVVMAERGE
jgi:uncharacterized RDD family membrane protein YckC